MSDFKSMDQKSSSVGCGGHRGGPFGQKRNPFESSSKTCDTKWPNGPFGCNNPIDDPLPTPWNDTPVC